jgi:hypothetical protein
MLAAREKECDPPSFACRHDSGSEYPDALRTSRLCTPRSALVPASSPGSSSSCRRCARLLPAPPGSVPFSNSMVQTEKPVAPDGRSSTNVASRCALYVAPVIKSNRFFKKSPGHKLMIDVCEFVNDSCPAPASVNESSSTRSHLTSFLRM